MLLAGFTTLGLAATGRAEESAKKDDRSPIVLTDRARDLQRRSLLIDGHNDMPWEIRKQGFDKLDISQPQPSLQTDIPRLREGGIGAQFWSVWVPVETGYQGKALSTTLEQIELVKAMIARYPDTFELALNTGDIDRIHKEGKIASLIGVEGGHSIEESLTVLEKLYNLGARYMTLTHSDTTSWADSGTDEARHHGLTPFGKEVVRKMNELGMMVDISHVSPETMRDAIDTSGAPIIFSHSSARAVAEHTRNVPDEILKRLHEKDGVVMVNFFSGFVVPEAAAIYTQSLDLERKLKEEKKSEDEISNEMKRWKRQHPMPRGSIHDLLDHIDHIAKVAGVQYVGIGSDYDGVSVLPTQLDDVSSYPYITQGLLDRGYTEEQIQGILGGNMMRVFRGVETYAEKHRKESK